MIKLFPKHQNKNLISLAQSPAASQLLIWIFKSDDFMTTLLLKITENY
jgi:hypothetical protein